MRIIIFVFCLWMAATNCPSSSPADLIASGNVAMGNNRVISNPRQHCYTVPIPYAIPHTGLSLALSASSISQYNPSIGFDFSVRGGRQDGSNAMALVLLINNDITWQSIKVSYLVSSHSDLIVGSFIADTFDFLSCTVNQDGRTTVATHIPSWKIADNTEYGIAIFMSGFRTAANNFNLNIINTSFDNMDGRLTVQLVSNAKIQTIHLSYVIYPKVHDNFVFQLNSQPRASGTYYLPGIIGVNQYQLNYHQFQVCTKGTTCPANQQPNGSGECVCTNGYIRVGDDCFRQCAPNAYITPRFSCQCIPGYISSLGRCFQQNPTTCPTNQQFNGNACVCKAGFYRLGQQCVRIPECRNNEQWDGRECACITGYVKRNNVCQQINANICSSLEVTNTRGQCVCRVGYIRVLEKCERQCAISAYFNSQFRCVCIPGYQHIQGYCQPSQTCPANEQLISGQCQCLGGYFRNPFGYCWPVPNCPANQQWRENNCYCIEGYRKNIYNLCQPIPQCPSNEHLVDGTCQCINGFYRLNNLCTQIPQCGTNMVWGGSSCVCRAGFIQVNTQLCIAEPVCGPNEVILNTECTCKNGYRKYSFNSECIPEIICRNNEIIVNGRCECPAGFMVDGSGNCVPLPKCTQNEEIQNGVCVCKEGYFRSNAGNCVKIPVCGVNQALNNNNVCECKFGFMRLGGLCVARCGINQVWTVDNGCVCADGHAWINGACRQCPSDSTPSTDRLTCVCNGALQIFIPNSLVCQNCPENAQPDGQKIQCLCIDGYQFNGDKSACVIIQNCPANSQFMNGKCQCVSEFYNDDGVCRPVPTCPTDSQWIQEKLKCECVIANQYLIYGVCQPCGANQVWNGQECECDVGYFLIGGVCVQCDIHSTYNGDDCVCNVGYFGDRNLCQRCHATCAQCSDDGAQSCISCIDISYELQGGFCVRDGPCPPGTFINPSQVCDPCSDYCLSCTSITDCSECAAGYQVASISFGAISAEFCEVICGDGFRNSGEDCDDGNTDDNDGCSHKCREEIGWTCSGGTSAQKSTCFRGEPEKIYLEDKGEVYIPGKVIQSVRMSYIPECFTSSDCSQCFKILKAWITNSTLPAIVKVNFIPGSKYQFTVEVDFGSTFVSTAFTLVVEINKDLPEKYDGCFSEQDYAQQLQLQIDPALLIIDQGPGELSLDDLFGG